MNAKEIQNLTDSLFSEEAMLPKSTDCVLKQPSFYNILQTCEKLTGKAFGQLDLAVQDAITLKRLQQIFNSIRLNPLWDKRFEQHGISQTPENFEQWQQLPLTDRETLNAYYMGERPGQLIGLSQGGFEIIASGGTSGGLPIETVYSLEELHNTYKISGDFMGKHVLPPYLKGTEPKWIITTLSDYEMWSSGTMIGGLLQQTPGVNFIAAGPMGQMVFNHVMSFQGPKAIMGMSREIEGLLPLGEKLDQAARKRFRLAIYGSGILQNKNAIELKKCFPNLEILSYFASNQAEAIGLQLEPDTYLKTVPGLHFIEIVDDAGKWVDVGEEGELVITRLHAKEAPIIRMVLGDRMIRRPDFSSASLITRQIEFAGRSSDIIHLGESHYAAPRAYDVLCSLIKEQASIDIHALAHEIQFQNDRKNKKLTFVASVDQPESIQSSLTQKLPTEALHQLFIQALKQSLSLFDQTDQQFSALSKTVYTFDLAFVEKGSDRIHKTRVNKAPLIKDSF